MKAKIAVATVSGRAYYALVNELKTRGLAFLSLTPYENVPLDVTVVITTPKERQLIRHQNILIYEERTDPATVVNEALRILEGKRNHETVVIGVDPGKTFGIAVLSDGNILETLTCSSTEETIDKVTEIFSRDQQAFVRVLKVGDWAPSYTAELLPRLDASLPKDVTIEIVREVGTSRLIGQTLHKHRLKHTAAAIKIAERHGVIYRRKTEETQ